MTRRIALSENGAAVEIELAPSTGVALAGTGFVEAWPVPGTARWLVRPLAKVGGLAVDGVEVHVAPKVPVARFVHLLQFSPTSVAWSDRQVGATGAPDLLPAVVEAFERATSRALRQGLLQGYRTIEEALPVVRGRIREADQLRRRYGLAVPVEVRYDDFTVDTAENRLLLAAVLAARRLPGLPLELRRRLLRLELQLADVTPVPPSQLEPWRPTRLNSRLSAALKLGEVLVSGSSFELGGNDLDVSGFVVDMAKVFEDVVCTVVAQRLRQHGGTTQTQASTYLDHERAIRMEPDLVWYGVDREARGVVDAKYKAEKPSGFPNADAYQMLAYCTALRLPVGHLVYAKGNGDAQGHRIAVRTFVSWRGPSTWPPRQESCCVS